jgi:tRNA nucleotidyltransferase (CCA-adding enzyme)
MDNKKFLTELLACDNVVAKVRENLSALLLAIPEISAMIGFEHRHPHHHLDVWEHTLLALSFSENTAKTRLALLLHDIGKPSSFQVDGAVRHYRGHAEKSARIASSVLFKLGFDVKFVNDITEIILRHDTPLSEADFAKNPTLSKEIFSVQRCDALAHNPEYNEKRLAYIRKIEELIKRD